MRVDPSPGRMADKEKLFLCWICCSEVMSLDLLGCHVEGSKAE